MLGIEVENEIERASALIIASEDWSSLYDKTPDVHAQLIKTEARLQRLIRGFFKELASNASSYINWSEYRQAINAYKVDVLVNDDLINESAGAFVKLTLKQVAIGTALGALSGEELYSRPLGITTADAVIQDMALNHVAQLVGMSVDKDGHLSINPKADMSILDTTRQDIRQSISTSIALGETADDATTRLSDIIDNPRRAETIARTETVNSFSQGLNEFGRQSGAVGHEWQDTGADDVCAENTVLGPIAFDDSFSDSQGNDIDGPTAHPNCRCSKRLIYQNELDDNPDLFNSGSADDSGDE